MSSHHIVREKQEPALLILGLDNFPDELLGQLLEWSPTLIVTSYTAEIVHAFGIKIDILVSDADPFENFQSDVKYIPAGNNSIINFALNYLIANNYPAVNIIADELSLNDYLAYVTQINIVIFYKCKKFYAIASGFNKWKPQGEHIELLGKGADLHTMGLEKVNDTNYKTVNDGFISIEFNTPFIFIAENIG